MRVSKVLFFVMALFIGYGNTSIAQKNVSKQTIKLHEIVNVYYFHYTRRCKTCYAVEAEAKKALQKFYAPKMANGEILFKSINLDDKNSEALANKYKVSGQALLIVKKGKQIDLTNEGFMNAVSNLNKFHEAIKNALK